MAKDVRVQLLGPVRAWRDGKEVELRGVSSRSVLACLALSPGTAVSTDMLTDALWGDDAPPNATGNLQASISRLRRGLGRDSIGRVPGGYRLDDRVRTDVLELESIIEEPASCEVEDAPSQLLELSAACSESPLDGVSPTIAFHSQRERLRELQLAAFDRVHRISLDSGGAAASIPELRLRAEAEPTREQTQLLHAEGLARVGRTAEALRVISRYRHLLRESSGLEPSASLRTLERAILDNSFAAPTAPDALTWATRTRTRWIPPDTPFVGREADLELLDAYFDQDRLITIAGAGGIGKSRLLMEFATRRSLASIVVRLSAVAADSDAARAVAVELGIEPSPSDLVWTIIERLRMTPAVLILDNCEHVIESARMLVAELLRQVDGLVILTTSRRRLGLPEERVHRLAPLALAFSTGSGSPAVEVFADRVARTVSDPSAMVSDPDTVARICRHLAGIPLALELAAPRVHLLGLTELQRQLESGRAPDSDHDRALEATVQWSLDLLGMDARQLFDEMCLFPAAFDIRALDAVTQVESPYGAFGELVEASLVNVEVDDGRQTFQVLEPIRQVGLQNVSEEIVEAYLIWVDDVTASIEASWIEGQPAVAVERLVRVLDDVQQAWLLLENRNRHDECEMLARRVTLPLTIRPDVALVSTILASEATTGNGLMAHASLAWGAGRPHDALADVDRLLEIVPASDPLVPLTYWGSTPACSFAGDAERMIRQAKLGFRHPAASPAARAYFAGYWALGELYRGDSRLANELIFEHAWAIESIDTAGFISFVRAEIAAADDLEGALDILSVGKDEADHAGSFMFSRMIEIATLSLHVRAGNHRLAIGLARTLVGRLIASGLLAQAWMTLRHVASLLADIGEYKLAIRVLDAADSSPEAPELFGDAVAGDRLLRRRLTQLTGAPPTGPNGAQPAPSAGDLWPEVDKTLARVGSVGSARERSAARPRTDRDGLSRPRGSATRSSRRPH